MSEKGDNVHKRGETWKIVIPRYYLGTRGKSRAANILIYCFTQIRPHLAKSRLEN
jgi:hypothetical protein